MSEWISVKDRLPENNSRIFCFSKGSMYDSFFIENNFLYLNPCMCLRTTKPVAGHVVMTYPVSIRNVTHWMSLPPAPVIKRKNK